MSRKRSRAFGELNVEDLIVSWTRSKAIEIKHPRRVRTSEENDVRRTYDEQKTLIVKEIADVQKFAGQAGSRFRKEYVETFERSFVRVESKRIPSEKETSSVSCAVGAFSIPSAEARCVSISYRMETDDETSAVVEFPETIMHRMWADRLVTWAKWVTIEAQIEKFILQPGKRTEDVASEIDAVKTHFDLLRAWIAPGTGGVRKDWLD